MEPYDWMEEGRQLAAQCWCAPETENKEMDSVLAETMACKLAHWMRIAAQYARNEDYYRALLIQCGKIIGKDAYICDDGSMSDSVLCAKIPELVEKIVTKKE